MSGHSDDSAARHADEERASLCGGLLDADARAERSGSERPGRARGGTGGEGGGGEGRREWEGGYWRDPRLHGPGIANGFEPIRDPSSGFARDCSRGRVLV